MRPTRTRTAELAVGVLGPLTVSVDARAVTVTAAQLRTVLTVLALSAGESISFDRLAAAVWAEDLPKDARRAVQVYVTRLRQLLGSDLIRTVPTGYALTLAPDDVDALRFVRMLDEAALVEDIHVERALLVDALALWRGEPFEGARSRWLHDVEAPRLVDRRLTALERRIELDLSIRATDDLVVELKALTARYPSREWFWGQLMTVLDLTGRRAEALETYHRLYRFLTGEYGIEPNDRVLRVYRRIAGQDVAIEARAPGRTDDAPVPRQLPGGTNHFVGRSAALAQLAALLKEHEAGSATQTIVVVEGAAGVGKTALAVCWASRVADRFPDGQLYVDLQGFDPVSTPMRPDDVIRGLLSALGVPRYRTPASRPAQAALYRGRMAGRRMLLLLDNARNADQVRALLPGAAGCFVLVTSRHQLTGPVDGEGWHRLSVDVLTDVEAMQLLTARLGTERVGAQWQAAVEIIERCARHPLALTTVAARAVSHAEFPLASLAGELSDPADRLDVLSGGDLSTDVRAVFTASYRTLTPGAARLFRLLAVHPDPDVSAPAAASLAGLPLDRVRSLLTELAGNHLITARASGRHAFHDLLRAYAAELLAVHESSDERRAATRRLLDHYLHTVQATYQLSPHRDHPTAPSDPGTGVVPEHLGDDGPEPLRWLVLAHPALFAVLRVAVDAGLDEHAWHLAWALGGYLARGGRWQEWAETQRIALVAVGTLGDASELSRAHRGLARAYRQLGRADEAHAQLRHAHHLCVEARDPVGLGHTYTVLGQVFGTRDDFQTALGHARRALSLFRSAGDPIGTAIALNSAGWYQARLGAHDEALALCDAALDLQRQTGDRYGAAATWDSLGYVQHHLGNFRRAAACYRSALDLRHDGGEVYGDAGTLVRLGDTYLALGDTTAARGTWRRAAAILEVLRHADAGPVRAKLRRLDSDTRRP